MNVYSPSFETVGNYSSNGLKIYLNNVAPAPLKPVRFKMLEGV